MAAFVGSVSGSVCGRGSSAVRSRARCGRAAAVGAGDPLPRRPGDRRRRAERLRPGHHELLLQPGHGLQPRSLQLAGFPHAAAHPAARRHPDPRRRLLRRHAVPVLLLRRGGRRHLRRCSTPGGGCASGRSASTRGPPTRWGSRVNRTRYNAMLIAGLIAGVGRGRCSSWGEGQGNVLQLEHVVRLRLHRPGRRDLRPLDAARGPSSLPCCSGSPRSCSRCWPRRAHRSTRTSCSWRPTSRRSSPWRASSAGCGHRRRTASRIPSADAAGHRLGRAPRRGPRGHVARIRSVLEVPGRRGPRWSTTAGSSAAATSRTRRTGSGTRAPSAAWWSSLHASGGGSLVAFACVDSATAPRSCPAVAVVNCSGNTADADLLVDTAGRHQAHDRRAAAGLRPGRTCRERRSAKRILRHQELCRPNGVRS